MDKVLRKVAGLENKRDRVFKTPHCNALLSKGYGKSKLSSYLYFTLF